MNDHEIARLKQMMLKSRAELERRTEVIRRDTSTQLSADWGEQAVELENSEVLDELGREAREELARIDTALGRIENGRYGECIACGEHIARRRLELVPWTSRCIACENAAETQRGSPRA